MHSTLSFLIALGGNYNACNIKAVVITSLDVEQCCSVQDMHRQKLRFYNSLQ